MSINAHIIYDEIKLMNMGGREEILLEQETMRLIIPAKIVATRGINPYMKGDSICRIRLIFIYAQILTPC